MNDTINLPYVSEEHISWMSSAYGSMELLGYLCKGMSNLKQQNRQFIAVLDELYAKDEHKNIVLAESTVLYIMLDACGKSTEEQGKTRSGLPIITQDIADSFLEEYATDLTNSIFTEHVRAGAGFIQQENDHLRMYLRVQTTTKHPKESWEKVFSCVDYSYFFLHEAGTRIAEREETQKKTESKIVHVDFQIQKFPRSWKLRRELNEALTDDDLHRAAELKKLINETGETL
jgi:hypothetical protein